MTTRGQGGNPSVSVRDVAAAARVSVGTVSNVLNNPARVTTDIAERVTRAIDELGYVRNDAARQLRAGRSTTVGLIVPDAANPFFTDVALGAEDAARAAGLDVLVGNARDDATRERRYLALFEEQRVRGILLSPGVDDAEHWHRLRERGLPVVLVDRPGDAVGLSSASVDDRAGGRLAVQHLLAGGARRVAVVGGSDAIAQVAERRAGARLAIAAVAGAGLETVDTAGTTVLEGRRAGERLLERAPAQRPDAVFAVNDLVAVGLLQALVMRGGLRVPDDLLLIGYDDIDFAESAIVPLSSVRQPSRRIGESAFELLLAESADHDLPPRQIVFAPELVTRDSSRR